MIAVRPAPELAQLTTLRLGGKPVALVDVSLPEGADPTATADALAPLPETLQRLGGMPVVLGRGSNILAKDGALPLVLVRMHCDHGPEIVGRSATHTMVRVGASVPLPRLVAWAAHRGLSGLEGLVGIPGAIGGGVAMNVGSYGCTLGPLIARMRLCSARTGVLDVEREALICQYRSLQVPAVCGHTPANMAQEHGHAPWWMVCEITLELGHASVGEAPQVSRARIMAKVRENVRRKRATQPVGAWSAGCVFENPASDVSAGKLLDEAGFRGRRLGGMALSALHANFLINEGQGSSTAAFELLDAAKAAVAARFGVSLEYEVKVWPAE